jgi:hypothetical protein
MDPSPQTSRAEQLAPWVVGALFALPVLIAKYPPMDDLPLHEASIGLLRHWGDARFAPPTLYALNLGHANQLFSFLVLFLAYAVPIGWASKLVIAASVVALPVAAAHFADHVGASRWTALLVAPVGMGWLFFWGLIQNILGLVALLWLLPSIDRFASSPTWRGALKVCGAMVVLHFAHQAMQLVACAALVLCSVGMPWRTKPMVLRTVPALFCIALAFAANRYSWRFAGPRHLRQPPFQWYPFPHKVVGIPGVLFGGYEPYIRNLVMLLALVPVVWLIVGRFQSNSGSVRTVGGRLHRWRFELLAFVLLAIYLAGPSNVRSTTLVYHRFLPPAWAILAVCAGIHSRAMNRAAVRALCTALPTATLLIAWPSFADSNRVYSDLEKVIDRMDIGSSVLALNLGAQVPHRLWNPLVAMGHVVAVRGGRSLFDYTHSPVSPVTQRAEKQWGATLDRIEQRSVHFCPDWDFTLFRYVLIITPAPALAAGIEMVFKNDAHLAAQSGTWYLFESNLPLVPVDADEPQMPTPHPPSLQKLLLDLAEDLRRAGKDGALEGAEQK